MKKLLYLVGLAMLVFACSESETIYSCDPQIDAIVKSGEIETEDLTLSEFLEYDLDLQRALFRSFTPEKQKALWLEKLDSVIINTPTNLPERIHLNNLRIFLNDNYGILPADKQQGYESTWVEHAQQTLKWSNTKIYFIVSSLCISESQYENLMNIQQESQTKSTRSADCSCSTESDYCGAQGGDCTGVVTCDASPGCGWLLQYDCNGSCWE